MAYPRQAVALIIVSAVFPVLALITALLRFNVRRVTHSPLILSDYFIIFTLIIALGESITCIVGATIGGIGESHVSSEKQVIFMKVLFITQFFYCFSVFGVKVAIVLFYKSIFVTPGFRRCANGVLAVLVAWIIAFFFVTLFQDNPISRNWGSQGTTVDFPTLYIVENSTDIALDLFILCMPLPVIRRLRMSTKRKWLLGAIFWLGAFCVVSSSIRLYYMVVFRQQYQQRLDDFSHTCVNTIIWGAIEPCTSIMAACLPCLGPLLSANYKKPAMWTYSSQMMRNHMRRVTTRRRQMQHESVGSSDCFEIKTGVGDHSDVMATEVDNRSDGQLQV